MHIRLRKIGDELLADPWMFSAVIALSWCSHKCRILLAQKDSERDASGCFSAAVIVVVTYDNR